MAKNKGGRPTKMTEATLSKLESAFIYGCTDVEACFVADISHQTLYTYQEKHPEFLERKRRLKTSPAVSARRVVKQAIEDGDMKVATWYLDKADGKAKQAMELTGQDGGAIQNRLVVEFVKANKEDDSS